MLEISDEKVNDSKMLKKLVTHVLKNIQERKNRVKKIKLVLADGAHDTDRNFTFVEKKESFQE